MPPVLPKYDTKDSTSTCQTSDNSKPEATDSVTLAFVGCPSNSTEISMNFGSENTSGTAQSQSAVCLKNETKAWPSTLKDNKNPQAFVHDSPRCSRFASSTKKDIDEEVQLSSASCAGQEIKNMPRLPSDQREFLGTDGNIVLNTTKAIDEIKSDSQSNRECHQLDCSETSIQIEGSELGSEDFSAKSNLKNLFVQGDVAYLTTDQESGKGKRKKSSQKLQKCVDGVEHVRIISPSRSACHYKEKVSPTTEVSRRNNSMERGTEDKPFASSSQRIRSDLRIYKNKSDGRYMDNPDGSTGGIISTEHGEVSTGLKFPSDQVQRPKAQGDAESMKKGNVVRVVSPTTKKRTGKTEKSRKVDTEACFINEDDQEQMEDGAKVKGPKQSVESVRLSRSKSKSLRDDYPSLDQMFNDVMKLLVQQSASESDHEILPIYDEDGRYELPETFPLSTLQNTCQSAHLCSWDEDVPIICRSSNRSTANTPFKEATILDFEDASGVSKFALSTPEDNEKLDNELEYFPSKGLLSTDNNLNCHHCYDDDAEECCQSWAFVDPEPSSGESSRGSFGSNEDINTQAEAGPQLRENGIERPCVRDMIKTIQERLSASPDTTTSKETTDKSLLLLNDNQWNDQTVSPKEAQNLRDQGRENDVSGTKEIKPLKDHGTINETSSLGDHEKANCVLSRKETEASEEREKRDETVSLRDCGTENNVLGTDETKGSEDNETMNEAASLRKQETKALNEQKMINGSLGDQGIENDGFVTKETKVSTENETMNEAASLGDHGIEKGGLANKETKSFKVHETINETVSLRGHGIESDAVGTKEINASNEHEIIDKTANLTDYGTGNDVLGAKETEISKEHEPINKIATLGNHGTKKDVLSLEETKPCKVNETKYETSILNHGRESDDLGTRVTKAFEENEIIHETASLIDHGTGNDDLGTNETKSPITHETQETQSIAQTSEERLPRDTNEAYVKLVSNNKINEDARQVFESDERLGGKENSLDQSKSKDTTKELKNFKTNVTILVTPASPLPAATLSAISDTVSESTDDSENEAASLLTVPEICTLPLAQHPDLIQMEEREREMIDKYRKMSESSKSEDWESNKNELLDDSQKESKLKKNAVLAQGIVASCFERAKDAITRARARSVSPVKALARLDDLFGKGKTMVRRIVKSWSVSDFNQIEKLACDNDSDMEIDFGVVEGGKSNKENTDVNCHGRAGIHEFMSETLVTNGDAHPPFFCLRINESSGRKQCSQLSRCDPLRSTQSSLARKENDQRGIEDEHMTIPDHEKLSAIDDQLEEVLGSETKNCLQAPLQHCKMKQNDQYDNEIKDDSFQGTLHDFACQSSGVEVMSSPSNTGARERSPILEPIEETDSNAESGHQESNDNGFEVSEDALNAIVACGMSGLETRDKELKEDGDAEEETDNRTCKVHACASCSECKRDVDDVSVHDDLSSSAPLKTFSLVYAGEAAHTESGVSDVMALISQEASIKRYPSFPDLTDLNDEEDPMLAAKESSAAMQSIPDLETDVVPHDETETTSHEGRGQANIFHSQTTPKEALTNVSFLRDESPMKPVLGEDCEKLPLANSSKVRKRTIGVNVRAIVSLLESRTASNSSGQEEASCIKAKSLPQTSFTSGVLTSKVPKYALSEASESTRSTQSAMSDTVYEMRGHEISDLNLPSPPNHSLSDGSTASGHKDSIKDSHSSSNEDIELHEDGVFNDQSPSKVTAKSGKSGHHTKLSRLRAALAQEYSPLTEEASTGHDHTTVSGPSSLEEKLLLEGSDLSLLSQIPDGAHAAGRDDSDVSSAQDNTDDLQNRKHTGTVNGCHGCPSNNTRCDNEKSEDKNSDNMCRPSCGECDTKPDTVESLPDQDVNERYVATSNEHISCPVDVSNAIHDMKEGQIEHDQIRDRGFDTRLPKPSLELIKGAQRLVESPCPISSCLDSGKEELNYQSKKLRVNSRSKAEGKFDDDVDVVSLSSDHSVCDKCNSCLLLDEPNKQGSKVTNASSSGARSATSRSLSSLDNLESENKVSETVEKTRKENVIKSIKLTKHGVSKNNWNNNLSVTFSEVTCARVRGRDPGNVKRCQSGYFNRTRNSLNQHGSRQTLDLKSMREDSCYTISPVSKIIGLPHQDECKKAKESKRMILLRRSSTSELNAVSGPVVAKPKSKKSKPSSLTMCTGNKALNITEAAVSKSLIDKPLLNKDSEEVSFSDNEPFSLGSVVIQNDFVSDSITEILTSEASNLDVAHSETGPLPDRPTESKTKPNKFDQASAGKPFSSEYPRPSFSEHSGKRDRGPGNTKLKSSSTNMKSSGGGPTKLSQRIYRADAGNARTYSFVSRSEQHIHRCDRLVAKSFETIRLSQSMISKSKKQMEDTSKAMKSNKSVNKPSHWK